MYLGVVMNFTSLHLSSQFYLHLEGGGGGGVIIPMVFDYNCSTGSGELISPNSRKFFLFFLIDA